MTCRVLDSDDRSIYQCGVLFHIRRQTDSGKNGRTLEASINTSDAIPFHLSAENKYCWEKMLCGMLQVMFQD